MHKQDSYRWIVVLGLATILALVNNGTCCADVMSDIYNWLKQLDGNANFPFKIQSDVVMIGRAHGPVSKGQYAEVISPIASATQHVGDLGTGVIEPEFNINVNGVRALIGFEIDNNALDTVDWDLTVNIIEIRNAKGVVFKFATEHWPLSKDYWVGKTHMLEFDVGNATLVSGTVTGYARPVTGQTTAVPMKTGNFSVKITRDPNNMAVGAFTIQVMPAAVLYIPSVGEGGKGNTWINYLNTYTQSTSLTTTLSKSNSVTKPTDAQYGNLEDLGSCLNLIQAGGKLSGTPAGGIVASILGSGLFGSSSANQTQGNSFQAANGRLLLNGGFTSETVGETKNAYVPVPGDDDEIKYFRGLRMAYVLNGDGQPTLVSLGFSEQIQKARIRDLVHDLAILQAQQPPPAPQYDPSDPNNEFRTSAKATAPPEVPGGKKAPVKQLRRINIPPSLLGRLAKPVTGSDSFITDLRDPDVISALIALDPLATCDPSVDPQDSRFNGRYQQASFVEEGGIHVLFLGYTADAGLLWDVRTDSTGQNCSFTSRTEVDQSSFLGKMLDLGPQTTQTTSATSSFGSAVQTVTDQSSLVTIHYEKTSEVADRGLEGWYDCAFGTIVLREVPNPHYFEGTAQDVSGSPLAHQLITLSVGGKTLTTRTDAKGHYVFHFYSPDVKPAKGKLTARGRTVSINVVPVKAALQRPTSGPTGSRSKIDEVKPQQGESGGTTETSDNKLEYTLTGKTPYYTGTPMQGRAPEGSFAPGTKVQLLKSAATGAAYSLVRSADGIQAFINTGALRSVPGIKVNTPPRVGLTGERVEGADQEKPPKNPIPIKRLDPNNTPIKDGVDMIPFDWKNLKLKHIVAPDTNFPGWYLVDGDTWLLSFPDDPDNTDGPKKAAERALEIIRHYRLNQQFFFGRPQRLVSYWMSDNRPPTGIFKGEEAIEIHPDKIEAKKVDGLWRVMDGDKRLVDFNDQEAEAQKCADVIKRYKFQYMCFMGPQHPYMTYFRLGGPSKPEQIKPTPIRTRPQPPRLPIGPR